MTDLRVLVVGCGSVGKRHLRNLKDLGVSFLGAVDTRADRREEAAQKVGVDKVYSSAEAALAEGYDAVVVGVPTRYHTAIAAAAVEAGAHVLVEKPIADREEGLSALFAEAERKQLVCMVGYSYRFWPALQKLKELLEAKTLGQVYSAQVTFSEYLPDWHPWEDYRTWFMADKELGGGAILDESHAIDFARWLFGEVQSVFCVNGKFSRLEITSDDLAEMILCFDSGVVASIHLDIFGRDHRKRMAIMGEQGNLYWDFFDNSVTLRLAAEEVSRVLSFNNDRNDMFMDEVRHFLACVAGKAKPPVDGPDGLRTLRVVLAAIESSNSGRLITLDGAK